MDNAPFFVVWSDNDVITPYLTREGYTHKRVRLLTVNKRRKNTSGAFFRSLSSVSTWMLRQRLSRCWNSNTAAPHSLWWLFCELHHAPREISSWRRLLLSDLSFCPSLLSSQQVTCPPSPVSQQAGMADGRQPDEHWSSNGQENGENGYSAYSSGYRENGYHGGAAAHAGTTGRNTETGCV